MGWRQDVRDNIVTALDAFQAANTTLVDKIERARPESLQDTKSIFVGGISEAIAHDSGTRRREATVELVCAIHLSDNAETTDQLEELADALVDHLTDNPHSLGPHTLVEPVRTTTVEVSDGGGIFIPAITVTCRALIQQGRQ